MTIRRSLLFLSLLALLATTARAEDAYPLRPITLVHGFAVGGNADVISRIVADQMSRELGQTVVVEAKPGAGGNIASDIVTKMRGDGYTLQLLVGGHTVSAALYRKLRFDPVNDYTFVSTVNTFPFFIATRPGAFKSLQDLILEAKKRPEGLTFGSAGVGTTQHLTGELLAIRTGARFTHIPFQGGSTAITALLRGDIDLVIEAGTVITGQAAAGKLDVLGVTSKARWPGAPELPTVAETVAPDFDIVSWTGLAAPAGTPIPVADKLRAALHRALAVAEVQERLRKIDTEPAPSSGEQMLKLVTQQIAIWTQVVDKAGLEKK